jgi:aminoglycoside/choline kinase family phosphotransferase
MLAAGERLQTKVVALQEQLSERPRTLMHGDFRMDNLVFPGKGADGLTVLDWQITSRGRGAFDLGYFLTTSMSPADRRAVEEELIASYLETLAAGGVRGYGRDEFMRDYRITAMFCLVYTAIVIGSLDMGNDRGLALFNAMLERNTAMVEDLEAWAVV